MPARRGVQAAHLSLCFPGMAEKGLEILAEARELTVAGGDRGMTPKR